MRGEEEEKASGAATTATIQIASKTKLNIHSKPYTPPSFSEAKQPLATTVMTEDDAYYFYQAADGQQVYLHYLNFRCLLAQYGSVSSLPKTVKAKVIELEDTVFQSEVWTILNIQCKNQPANQPTPRHPLASSFTHRALERNIDFFSICPCLPASFLLKSICRLCCHPQFSRSFNMKYNNDKSEDSNEHGNWFNITNAWPNQRECNGWVVLVYRKSNDKQC